MKRMLSPLEFRDGSIGYRRRQHPSLRPKQPVADSRASREGRPNTADIEVGDVYVRRVVDCHGMRIEVSRRRTLTPARPDAGSATMTFDNDQN
jgi:hypothetical protein